MELLVASDLHLNYFDNNFIKNLGKSFSKIPANGLIICGDISLSTSFSDALKYLQEGLEKSIYFVLGNHDFWGSSFEKVEEMANALSNEDIVWLNKQDVHLNDNTVLSGFDGWYDCVNNIENVNSGILMRDWIRIENFYSSNKSHIEISKERSQNSYKFSDRIIKNQKSGYKNQIIITHVPPFPQLVKEKPGHEAYYTSIDAGNMLISACSTLEKTICLSGHTHNKAEYVVDNIHCYTMEACRGKPNISGILSVSEMKYYFL